MYHGYLLFQVDQHCRSVLAHQVLLGVQVLLARQQGLGVLEDQSHPSSQLQPR